MKLHMTLVLHVWPFNDNNNNNLGFAQFVYFFIGKNTRKRGASAPTSSGKDMIVYGLYHNVPCLLNFYFGRVSNLNSETRVLMSGRTES